MRITFVRHATFALKMDGTAVMVDPMMARAGATDSAGTNSKRACAGKDSRNA